MKAKKSLGQNFLIDKNIIDKIENSINATENDLIIEIGPGMGALTKVLKQKNANLICYEIDHDMIPYLKVLEDEKTKIIFNDILLSNIKEDIKNINYNNLFIVGNLPYYITTPIIRFLIDLKLDIKEMLFMVQEEVADRFTALPGTKEYGSITLYLKYYFNIEKLFRVSKNCFKPVPKVESAIIRFEKRERLPQTNEEKYFKLIVDSFKMKRKTLKNNLSGYNFDKIKKILVEFNLSESVRAEELDEKVFVAISNNI
ncbi:MAG: ribosomal RNA small subunit methyltransferase A [Firmicutes bacterium]|nr:ribosomal RNA small subunit methyltransferase A [Bacillota bacterium]